MKVIFRRHEGDTWTQESVSPLPWSGLCTNPNDTFFAWNYWLVPLEWYPQLPNPAPRDVET